LTRASHVRDRLCQTACQSWAGFSIAPTNGSRLAGSEVARAAAVSAPHRLQAEAAGAPLVPQVSVAVAPHENFARSVADFTGYPASRMAPRAPSLEGLLSVTGRGLMHFSEIPEPAIRPYDTTYSCNCHLFRRLGAHDRPPNPGAGMSGDAARPPLQQREQLILAGLQSRRRC